MFITSLLIHCATSDMVSIRQINNEFSTMRYMIIKNRSNIGIIAAKKVGKTGFFYLINQDGIILHHPVPSLSGKNFGRYDFIKKIITQKAGCFTYNLGRSAFLVYFNTIGDTAILCLSIPADEITDPGEGCAPLIKQQ